MSEASGGSVAPEALAPHLGEARMSSRPLCTADGLYPPKTIFAHHARYQILDHLTAHLAPMRDAGEAL